MFAIVETVRRKRFILMPQTFSRPSRRLSHGFTIVELLIVIVVIGILSTLVLSTYANAQKSARNAARVSVASQFREGVQALIVQRGTFGDLLVQPGFLLSSCYSTGFPDVNGDGLGDCHYNSSTVIASESPAFIAEIEKISKIPDVSKYPPNIHTDGTVYRSLFVYTPIIDGVPAYAIEYSLEGHEQDCKLSPVVDFTGGNYSMNTGGRTYSGHEDDGNSTLCIIRVVD